MKDFVSGHRASVFALLGAISVACAIFVPHGFWPGVAGAGVALLAAGLMTMRSRQSIWQVIHDVETEPGSRPQRVARAVGGERLKVEGGRS